MAQRGASRRAITDRAVTTRLVFQGVASLRRPCDSAIVYRGRAAQIVPTEARPNCRQRVSIYTGVAASIGETELGRGVLGALPRRSGAERFSGGWTARFIHSEARGFDDRMQRADLEYLLESPPRRPGAARKTRGTPLERRISALADHRRRSGPSKPGTTAAVGTGTADARTRRSRS